MSTQPIYIVDEIAQVITAVDAVINPAPATTHINYMYGHFLEIINRLQQLTASADILDRQNSFPLIALLMDFEEEKGSAPGVYSSARLHMLIANTTQPAYLAADRYENNFKPVLYPIYHELLHQLAAPVVKSIFVEDEELMQHTKIDRINWGKEGLYGNQGNMFNDYIDCIEIKGLKISFYNKY